MTEIADLRARYDAVMQGFAEAEDSEAEQSARVLDAIADIGEYLHRQRQVVADQKEEISRLTQQNEDLRSMLLSLLVGIESRNRGHLSKVMHDLEARLTALSNMARAAGGDGPPQTAAPPDTGQPPPTPTGGADLDIPNQPFQTPSEPPPFQAPPQQPPQQGYGDGNRPFPEDQDASGTPPPFPQPDPDVNSSGRW